MLDRMNSNISTYPRKGTETAIVVVNNDDLVAFQLIPSRGRKQNCHLAGRCVNQFQLIPVKPSQALRASSPEGRAFTAAVYPDVKLPLRGSWHGVSRD